MRSCINAIDSCIEFFTGNMHISFCFIGRVVSHKRLNNSFSGNVCVNCGYDKTNYCTCKCHASNPISKLIYKFILFFWKILRINNECACGATSTETIKSPGRRLVYKEAKAATCTEPGYEAYEYCTACSYTTYKAVSETGHKHTSEVTTPATHLSTGVMTYTCHCGNSKAATARICVIRITSSGRYFFSSSDYLRFSLYANAVWHTINKN